MFGAGFSKTVGGGSASGSRVIRAPKQHINKNKDRDIPYKPPYNEAQ